MLSQNCQVFPFQNSGEGCSVLFLCISIEVQRAAPKYRNGLCFEIGFFICFISIRSLSSFWISLLLEALIFIGERLRNTCQSSGRQAVCGRRKENDQCLMKEAHTELPEPLNRTWTCIKDFIFGISNWVALGKEMEKWYCVSLVSC